MRLAFVTGGTGFLGRHVVEQLAQAGWHTVALHRATSDVRHLRAYGAALALGSITDPESLQRAMPQDCDAVFHVAGNTSLWSGDRAQQTLENVDGTRFMVETALAKKAKRFIHTSSESAWGDPQVDVFDETTPQRGVESPIHYERTKHLGELEVVQAIARGLQAVILCPGHIIGRYDATQWARMITMVARGRLPGIPPGEGTWASAVEVARAHLAAVDRGRVGERYLLGGSCESYVEMVRIVGELTGRKVPARPLPVWVIRALARVSHWGSFLTRRAPTVTLDIAEGAKRHTVHFRSDKATRELGYRAVPLRDLLTESYQWLQSEGLVG